MIPGYSTLGSETLVSYVPAVQGSYWNGLMALAWCFTCSCPSRNAGTTFLLGENICRSLKMNRLEDRKRGAL